MKLAAAFVFFGIVWAVLTNIEILIIFPPHQKVLNNQQTLCPGGHHTLPGTVFKDETILKRNKIVRIIFFNC